VQLHGALGDALARPLLGLGPALHSIWTWLIGHCCLLNMTRAAVICIVRATLLSYEKENAMQTAPTRVVGPADGKAGFLGSIGVRFMLDGEQSDGGFALVEHPMSAHALAAPLHKHAREDEYSYVLEGRMGALLGEDVLEAGPGDLVFKPRDQWHTFWNAGDDPCRILEIIAPAGFERFFAELVDLGGVTQADPAILGALCERYALEMDPSSVPGLIERFGVRFPGEPLGR
jgi:mannose-6-phosphate isomerase-like protein (cupin superfamily)